MRAIDGERLSLAWGTFEEDTNPKLTVAAKVLEICRGCGLDAQWTGDGEDYIELPSFRWQRRLRMAKDNDLRDFLDGIDLEIRAGYTAPEDILSGAQERAESWFEKFADFGLATRSRIVEHTERVLGQERKSRITVARPYDE